MASSASEENVDNYVKVTDGLGGLPKVTLTCVHGSEAEIYLYGGCITSWRVDSTDLLYVRPDAVFTALKPISGGIPHCFPQFGPGPMQQASVSGASVKGLKGCKTLNKDPDPRNPVEGMEERDVVTFPGFVDCIYVDAPEELYLDNGLGDSITIKNTK
ncbi:UNVERIFIED_CONTAM: putative glucose-6-phosphate 1-epimerase [Sesamum latifolium]|uniref:Glucose-6-phosphate 1-epimerase n=1 Tax=Sesamum latifolium TaxID=2727402 RepID=A0AAW2Y8Q8_9LAMI